ncbi:MAG: hypothetical protein M4579_000132 [Chaenotheca gracillima]|nr:MAG: hypothetical protein M4579_000132 [Chaenotheca gracillima]
MSTRPGEELLLTLFADVRYLYSAPTTNPAHHRFDKGSYVYLFRNPSQRQGRLEIANHAGTPEQDAFTGLLDNVRIEYNYKQPALVTVVVDGKSPSGSQSGPGSERDWHLPTFDPKNETKYMYKLHTVDIYLWRREDAADFLSFAESILQTSQLSILNAEAAPKVAQHSDAMSPVVQKLEQAAISDTTNTYGRSASATNNAQSMSFAPPPTNGGASGQGIEPDTQPANYAPLAYNPAAPAAPEPIKHREKTPPPVEGAGGTGLAAAAAHDSAAPYSQPSFSNPSPYTSPPVTASQQQYFPSATQQQQQQPASYTPVAPSAVSQHGSQPSPAPSGGSFGAHPQRASSYTLPPPPPQGTGSAGPPQGQQYAQSFAPPPQGQMSPPLQSPGLPGYQPGQGSTPQPYQPQPSGTPQQQYQPQQHQQQASQQYAQYPQSPGFPSPGLQSPGLQSPGIPPVGGYAQYQYGQPQPQQADPYNIHAQAYRPTEAEAQHGHAKPPAPGPGQQPGRFESQSARVEKGVNKLFKRLEKKIG